MERILVTGGAGLIGVAICRKLLEKGYQVRCLDYNKSPIPGVESMIGTIMAHNDLTYAIRGCTGVCHLAAMLGVSNTDTRWLDCLEINLWGLRNVLDVCVKERVKQILFSSSSEVYGDAPTVPVNEKHPLIPKSVYAVTKVAGEALIRAYTDKYDLNATILRFFNVYGPHQVERFVIPLFIKAVKTGHPIIINGDGSQIRAFCYVDDAANGMTLAMERDNIDTYEAFNIGNDTEPINILDLAEFVIKISGTQVPIHKVPFAESDRSSEREIMRRIPDISKARNRLNYEPLVTLEKGLIKTLNTLENRSDWSDNINLNILHDQ